MQREYYSSTISAFLSAEDDWILGQLLIHDEFETTDLQKKAWREEISTLKSQLSIFPYGSIAFEYTIPRVGHRIDTVCIIDGVIFLIEFKVGGNEYKKTTDDQVMDYALDLKYFHEASRDRYIIPISVPTEASATDNSISFMDDRIANVLHCNKSTIQDTFSKVLSLVLN